MIFKMTAVTGIEAQTGTKRLGEGKQIPVAVFSRAPQIMAEPSGPPLVGEVDNGPIIGIAARKEYVRMSLIHLVAWGAISPDFERGT
jgi:hypothetical protein